MPAGPVYTPITWVEGVTTLGPTHMNHLEGGVAAALSAPTSPTFGDAVMWNGSAWVNSAVAQSTQGSLTTANNDLTFPGPAAIYHYVIFPTAGGSIRSLTAGTNVGDRFILENVGAGNITIKHQLAGGGPQFFNIAGVDLTIPNATCQEYAWDGARWFQVAPSNYPASLITGSLPIANLAGYPGDAARYLQGAGGWQNLWLAASGGSTTANQDLSPTAPNYYYTFNGTGGGTLRSATAPYGAGSRLSIRAGLGSGSFTVKHALAGGSGSQFFLRTTADTVMLPNETLEFLYDGTFWVEQNRDVAPAASTGITVYERRTTAVDVNTTTTEKSLYDGSTASSTTGWPITGNDLSTNKTYRLTILGDYLYNNVNTDTLIVKVKFNNIVMWQGTVFPSSGMGTGTQRHPFTLTLWLTNLAATNVQNLHGVFTSEAGNTGAPTTGRGVIDVVNNRLQGGTLGGSGTVDTTASQKFDVTVTWSASSANNSFKAITAVSELM